MLNVNMLNVNNVNELQVLVNQLVKTNKPTVYFTVQNNEDECLQLRVGNEGGYYIEVMDLYTMLTVNSVYCTTPQNIISTITNVYGL